MDSTGIGIMNRWLSGIVIFICSVVTTAGVAQVPLLHVSGESPGTAKRADLSLADDFVLPILGHHNHYSGISSVDRAQLVPDERHWAFGPESRLGSLWNQGPGDVWVRFDLLHWRIKGADNTRIGAPVGPSDPFGTPYDLTGRDRLRRLNAIDRISGPRPESHAIVPFIGSSEENGLNGFRGTFGIPTTVGVFEGSGFVLEDFQDRVIINPTLDSFVIPPSTGIGAITLLSNGNVVSDAMVLFSEGLQVRHATRIFGFETNWVNNPVRPNVGTTLQPIVGFRYISFEDNLQIRGSDIPDPNDPFTVLDHRINSRAENHIFGPQIGFRAESQIRSRFSLGTDLKFMFGFNRFADQVSTSEIFSETELPRVETNEGTRFAPIVDFSVYGRFQATQNMSLLIAYQMLAGGGFSRSYDSIYYNSSASVTDPPRIGVRSSHTSFYAHGINFGLEILLP